MVKKDFLAQLFLFLGFSLLLFLYALLWKTQITTPQIHLTADFIAFYTAGHIADEQGAPLVYDQQEQLNIQSELQNKEILSNELLSYNHLPFLIPLLSALITENYTASFTRWALFLLAFTILSALILQKSFPQKKSSKIWMMIGTIFFYPSFISILKGQDTAIMLFGVSLLISGLLAQKEQRAGLGLSLVTIRPHIALMLAIPFLFRRQKIFWWFVAGASALAAFSIFLIGFNGTRQFIELLLISSRGEGFQLKPEAMFNLVGILARAFPAISHQALEKIGWLGFGLAILSLSVLWYRSKEISKEHIGMAIILSLFFAPHLHYHDLALLLIPLLTLLYKSNIKSEKMKVIILLGVSLALFSGYYLPSIYIMPYSLMLVLALLISFRLSKTSGNIS